MPPSVAASLSPLGNLLQLMGDSRRPSELYERSLKIREKWLGRTTSDVEKSRLPTVGVAGRRDRGLRARARRATSAPSRSTRRSWSPDHLTLARDLGDALAGVLLAAGDHRRRAPGAGSLPRDHRQELRAPGVPENLGLFR